MRAYPVPVQLDNEERIIGGVLTLRHIIYLILGLALGGGAGMGAFFLPLYFRIFLAALGLSAGAALAFAPVAGMSMDIYLLRWFQWRTGRRVYFLKGED